MNLMEQFANPELVHDLTVGQKLAGSGITTIMGMGITFVVLFFLWGCIALMARIINRRTSGPDSGSSSSVVATLPIRQPTAQETCQPAKASNPLPAIIAAAVCQYEGGNDFVVRKIARSSGWAYAGRISQTEREVRR